MTPGDMLTLLYDGLIKEIYLAQCAFEKKDLIEVNTKLQKSQAIVRHLQGSLDHKYEVSGNLNALYDYFLQNLIQANIKKDVSQLSGIVGMVTELRNTYIQADKQVRATAATR